MTFSPLFPFALGGFYTPHASGTFRAVFGPVGAGGEQRPADGAPFGVLETEKIELHDERKEMLRGKTARYMYAYTLLIIGVSVIIFQILSSLTVIEGGRVVIIYLGALFFSELFLSKWIFRKLERKY